MLKINHDTIEEDGTIVATFAESYPQYKRADFWPGLFTESEVWDLEVEYRQEGYEEGATKGHAEGMEEMRNTIEGDFNRMYDGFLTG